VLVMNQIRKLLGAAIQSLGLVCSVELGQQATNRRPLAGGSGLTMKEWWYYESKS
jgi:hypothetical protein